jgi:hypothetical protein
VSLHLPPEGLRVLTTSEPVEDVEATGVDVPAAYACRRSAPSP